MGYSLTQISTTASDFLHGELVCFRIGGIALELDGGTNITQSLERFQVHPPCTSDIEIGAQWTDAIEQGTGSLIFDSGSVWQLVRDDQGLRFDFKVPTLGERPYRRLRIDDEYRHATIQISREYFSDSTSA